MCFLILAFPHAAAAEVHPWPGGTFIDTERGIAVEIPEGALVLRTVGDEVERLPPELTRGLEGFPVDPVLRPGARLERVAERLQPTMDLAIRLPLVTSDDGCVALIRLLPSHLDPDTSWALEHGPLAGALSAMSPPVTFASAPPRLTTTLLQTTACDESAVTGVLASVRAPAAGEASSPWPPPPAGMLGRAVKWWFTGGDAGEVRRELLDGDSTAPRSDPSAAGFFTGILHGALLPFRIAASIFLDWPILVERRTDDYGAGFVCGVLLLLGGGRGARS